ncbi:anti-sigma factor [Planococcus sp. N028]|uniref:Anti-sigma-W factor RsiW n=1 Tax=Planococcus shixiaomingii TaxID=3058393 RepID=A0ABT8N2N3_9BACL|nr:MULTISPECIES: anti-sigma factor [unclassified Planococcus (in: firmicutes)]MDN7242141.1 anti-sigma factor [Planococcus sp. N028]WKA54414.1 anti-sigma factor [Planococcus sp. N022]
MTKMDCEHVVDFLNGTLTEEEMRKFEEHLKTCADCQEIVELTGELPYLAEPIEPPAEMKTRILANVFSEEPMEEVQPARKPIQKPTPAAMPAVKPKRKNTRWMPLVAAVLLLSLLGNAYAFFQLSNRETVETAEPAETALQEVELQPSEAFGGDAQAKLIRDGDSLDVVVAGSELEQLQGDEIYQVWLLKEGQPIPAGAFTPSQTGEGAAYFSLKENTEGWDTIAITREPKAGNQLPEGEIVLSSEI